MDNGRDREQRGEKKENTNTLRRFSLMLPVNKAGKSVKSSTVSRLLERVREKSSQRE